MICSSDVHESLKDSGGIIWRSGKNQDSGVKLPIPSLFSRRVITRFRQIDRLKSYTTTSWPNRHASKPKGSQLCKAKNQGEGPEGEKKIVIAEGRYQRKMVGSTSSAADQSASAVTEATNQHKQTGRKPEKTRAQKNAHNARCVKYRQKIKMRFEELEKVETEYFETVRKFNQMRAENQRIKEELNEKNSKIRCMEIQNQELWRALEKQEADQARMRLIPTGWNINGRNFCNFDEWVAWFASQTYEQVRQGAGTSETALGEANELVGLGMTGIDNYLPSIVANNGLSFVFGAPNSRVNDDRFPHHDLAASNEAGFLNNSGAGSSFAANSDLPMLDSPNNHDDQNTDLLTRDPDTGSLF